MPHGIMPDSARQEGSETTYGLINNRTSFKAGHAKLERSGRKRGVPNKLTADIKEAIVTAYTMLGDFRTRPPEELRHHRTDRFT